MVFCRPLKGTVAAERQAQNGHKGLTYRVSEVTVNSNERSWCEF